MVLVGCWARARRKFDEAGNALHYIDGEWAKLVRYVEDGRTCVFTGRRVG